MPGEAKVVALPVAGEVGAGSKYRERLTLEPRSPFKPKTRGLVAVPGELGVVPAVPGPAGIHVRTDHQRRAGARLAIGVRDGHRYSPFAAAVVLRSRVICVRSVQLTLLTTTPPLTVAPM